MRLVEGLIMKFGTKIDADQLPPNMRCKSIVFSPRPKTIGTARQQSPALRQLTPCEVSLLRSLTVFFINNNTFNKGLLFRLTPKQKQFIFYIPKKIKTQKFYLRVVLFFHQVLTVVNKRLIQSMQVHKPLNSQYTCSTCLQNFDSSQSYKLHYKSDYHRYNIKRKMVKLPPVTPQQFSTKLQQTQNASAAQFVCNQCRKTFSSANTFNQHVETKGHNPNVIIEAKQKIPQAPAPFVKSALKCIFCKKPHQSFELNLEHMETAHSFFVAQQQYCKNIPGLIEYLQEKIEVGHMCITCENKGVRDFQSPDAVRKHMADKDHVFMKVQEGYEEYEKFYDFSALFEEKLKEQETAVPGIEFQKVKVFVDEQQEQKKDAGEEEWQDQESGQEQDGVWEEIEEQQNEGEQADREPKKRKTKTYMIMKPTMTANDELLLPNGKLLGHRKYRHLYKQVIRMPLAYGSQLKMLTNGQNSTALSTLHTLHQRRQVLEMMKAQKVMAEDMRRQKKYNLSSGMRNNGLMYYFRCQNPL